MPEEHERKLLVPFGTQWYRTENVDLKKVKGEWVVHFSGKVTPYEVGLDTYRDFRKLAVPVQYKTPNDDEFHYHDSFNALVHQSKEDSTSSRIEFGWVGDIPRPGDDALEFFRKWGPLGFYYSKASYFLYDDTPKPAFDVQLADTVDEWVSLEDYWMEHHGRKLRIGKTQTEFPKPDEIFDGYFESWGAIHNRLQAIQYYCFDWERDGNTDDLNTRIAGTSLRPYVVQKNDKKGNRKHQLTFAFTNLMDALMGLLAQEAIGEFDIRECKNCGGPFDAIATGRTTFCCTNCLVEYPDKQKREDPVIKYRRMLQRRLERRREVGDEESRSINAELLAEKSVDGLKTVEDKYLVILGKKK